MFVPRLRPSLKNSRPWETLGRKAKEAYIAFLSLFKTTTLDIYTIYNIQRCEHEETVGLTLFRFSNAPTSNSKCVC